MFKTKIHKNKINLLLLAAIFVFLGLLLSLSTVSAATHQQSLDNKYYYIFNQYAQIIPGAPDDKATKDFVSANTENPIFTWLNLISNILAGIVGVGAILMVIWGGIQYITARDNAQAVQSAKEKIINVVIGLAAFIFLYAFLQWLIPGGIFA